MKIPYFCCIGAELKRYAKDFDFMNQVYLYKVPTDDTIEEVLSEDYFKAISDSVLQDDLVYIYEASAETLHSCRFDKQNGHITAVPLASDETLTGAVTTIIHDNLTPNKLLKSDENGKVAASDLNESDLITEARLQSEITRRAVIKDSNVVQEMQSGLKAPSAEFDNAPTTNDTTTYQNATSDSLVRKEQVDEVIQDIKTSSLTFIGYVSATEPSSATYAFNTGDLWLNSATMPTSFPFPQANIKEWNGSAWVAHSQDYTPANFDFFRNVNNNEGYYWFGGEWVVMSTDMSTTYFQLNPVSGKWEIKSNVNLPGAPTTTTPSTDDNSTKIATTEFTGNAITASKQKTISNCITEIPQDIKLELNNGTLTLKAGSKVYVPNGAGVFDEIVIASDLTHSYSGETSQFVVFYDHSAGVLRLREPTQSFSGTTAPTAYQYEVWYDTTNNIIKHSTDTGSTWSRQYSFPVCIGSTTTGVGFTSIDQVFNGFGYIGSTVFVLPGVKGLIPDGRNADGSLKSIETEITNVQTYTYTNSNTSGIYVGITSSGTIELNGERIYNEAENVIYNGVNPELVCEFAYYINPSGKIANFTPKTAFHAVDYNEADFVVDFQRPTADNNYTWYRKYKSGWVEQGGQFTATSVADGSGTAGNNTINLPIKMANDRYWYSANTQVGGSGWEYANGVILNARSQTTLTLKVVAGTGNFSLFWEVKGMAA